MPSRCKEHSWQKWHPNEECLICRYKAWYRAIKKARPDWSNIRMDSFCESHQLGELPRKLREVHISIPRRLT